MFVEFGSIILTPHLMYTNFCAIDTYFIYIILCAGPALLVDVPRDKNITGNKLLAPALFKHLLGWATRESVHSLVNAVTDCLCLNARI